MESDPHYFERIQKTGSVTLFNSCGCVIRTEETLSDMLNYCWTHKIEMNQESLISEPDATGEYYYIYENC